MNVKNFVLSVIIPAYNESKRIVRTLEQIESFLSHQSFGAEILVVNDGSTDDTEARVKDFIAGKNNFRLLNNEVNQGKGFSVQYGVSQAKGDYILFTDADLSTPIEEVLRMLPLMDQYDILIASRRLKGAHLVVRQPIFREFSGRIYSVLVRLLLLRGFIDTQCGFKLFKAEAAKQIFFRQTIDRFGFDVEVLYLAVKLGYRIKEFPVQWTDSAPTTVHLLRDSSEMFFDLLRIRRNDWKGLYDED